MYLYHTVRSLSSLQSDCQSANCKSCTFQAQSKLRWSKSGQTDCKIDTVANPTKVVRTNLQVPRILDFSRYEGGRSGCGRVFRFSRVFACFQLPLPHTCLHAPPREGATPTALSLRTLDPILFLRQAHRLCDVYRSSTS